MASNATPLKRRTLRDEVLDYLLDRIFKQEYKPGDRIVESRIAKELEISQGAVREAFRDFVAMGFLETKPYTATRLRGFTNEDLLDYYEFRTEIETLAITWAIEKHHSSLFDFPFMKQCIDKLYVIHTDEDPLARSKVGLAFHGAIVKASGSGSLIKAWNSLGQYYWSLMGIHFKFIHSQLPTKETDKRNAEQHLQIYSTLLEGDLEKACTLMKKHFQAAMQF